LHFLRRRFPYTIISVIEGNSLPVWKIMPSTLVPGVLVRHPERPEWGLGQVQSAVGPRVTVNFENAGKLLINTDVILLETIEGDGGPNG
jgi:hypothetical protein